jgi:AcrR family transcriptional regulator
VKRKTTKEILADSFRELAEKKPISKITVQEIADNCDYSSATFYRQFRDKYDLIAWDYITRSSVIMNQIGVNGQTWTQAAVEGYRFLYGQREYIKNLLEHTSGHDSFFRYMAAINTDLLTKEIRRASGNDQISEELMVTVRIYCYGTVQLICEWLMGEYTMTPEHLAELSIRALPEPLIPYLRKK